MLHGGKQRSVNACSGACKKLAPEYKAAAAQLADLTPPRYIAKVDITENKELESRF